MKFAKEKLGGRYSRRRLAKAGIASASAKARGAGMRA